MHEHMSSEEQNFPDDALVGRFEDLRKNKLYLDSIREVGKRTVILGFLYYCWRILRTTVVTGREWWLTSFSRVWIAFMFSFDLMEFEVLIL